MPADFTPVVWDEVLEHDTRRLIRLALEEDLGDIPGSGHDWTTEWVVDSKRAGAARIVTRQAGIVAGLRVVELVIEEANADLRWEPTRTDGVAVQPGDSLGTITGNAAQLLTCERVILNLLGRLCGVATFTQEYVQAIHGTTATVYDTRKTTPGWRRLEKYAVRCGGGHNHRTGLFDAVMIKDNHLALSSEAGISPAEAVFLARSKSEASGAGPQVIEVEVDTLEQLAQVLPAGPDVVLLDNMSCDELRDGVALRDRLGPQVVLEASGGVQLGSIGPIAQTGVERISVGALTHSAVGLDIGLDWSVFG